jgi:hypothetical protein
MERQTEQHRVADNAASRTIATILRHNRKQNSYKLALIRAINDVVLSFPDTGTHDEPVAIPLRILAEYWLAYYWPLVDPRAPISQGPHSPRNGALANDVAFRPALATLRQAWQEVVGEAAQPSDGFFLIVLPTHDLLLAAAPRLELAYEHCSNSRLLADALCQDVAARFTRAGTSADPQLITTVVVNFLDRAPEARNLARFSAR